MTRALGLCLLVLLSANACTRPTYVNIPKQPGDIAFHSPNNTNIRTVMAEAILGAMENEPFEGPYAVILPEDSDQLTYEYVVNRVGGGAVTPDAQLPADAVDGALPAVHVAGVRVRNRRAEVDLVKPSGTGREVTTVYLKWYYGGVWGVERVRPWRASLGEDLPVFRPAGAEDDASDGDAPLNTQPTTTAPMDEAPYGDVAPLYDLEGAEEAR